MTDVAASAVLAPAAKPGDLDRIFRKDTGISPLDMIRRHPDTGQPDPGPDCVACPDLRTDHTGWGCDRCSCGLSIALITAVRRG